MGTKINRVGEEIINKYGINMKIIEYRRVDDIDVLCVDYNFKIESKTYGAFKRKLIKTPYDKSVYGVGKLGCGEYQSVKNGVPDKKYDTWRNMLGRCYDKSVQEKHPTYIGCEVCEEWHDFQNFAKWYDCNYYEINGERMALDKDILVKGNRLYSPETCVFTPMYINNLFTNGKRVRGEFPIGVKKKDRKNPYTACCRNSNGKLIQIGYYNNPEEAFYKYKRYKEDVIKEVAEQYKDRIPEKLYNAMINYQVEITD